MDFILTTKLCQSTSHLTKKLNQVRRTSLENMSNNTQSSKKKDLKVKTPKKKEKQIDFFPQVLAGGIEYTFQQLKLWPN